MNNTDNQAQPLPAEKTPAVETARATETQKPKSGVGRAWEGLRHGFQSIMPQWVLDNSTRINQLGLMAGTTVIMGSIFRNRTISKDIWKEQTAILQKEGLNGAALESKIEELIKAKVMKKPGVHRQRAFYLGTAITGLGIGGFIKDKETPEERAEHKDMSLPQYMGMRLTQALDPMHHSRQTAGVVGATSGVLAIISAFTQPGGALISEAFVGATLVSGFTGLTLIDDPAKAKQALNICWASRFPFVVSGTYETLRTYPAYTDPRIAEIKKTSAYANGVVNAMREGEKVPRFGLAGFAGYKNVFGGKAADAFTKRHVSIKLPYLRSDWSYPIGQWFNMAMATFGFLAAGSDAKKKFDEMHVKKPLPVPANDVDEKPTHPVAANDTHDKPGLTISQPHATERLATAPEQNVAAAHG